MESIRISQALSDPVRYKILMMLANQESTCCQLFNKEAPGSSTGLCNCEIMSQLNMIQSRVSYHMKELVETGLVDEEPRGKWKYYILNSHKFRDYIEQLNRDFKL